jgi:hypothetical protein
MFASLCGAHEHPLIFLITTMWDKVSESEGEIREKELMGSDWEEMVHGGATVLRFDHSPARAATLLDNITGHIGRTLQPTAESSSSSSSPHPPFRPIICRSTALKEISDGKILLLASPKLMRPPTTVSFRISSHDQGWSSHPQNQGTYNNSWTWFEATIKKPSGRQGGSWRVATNMHAKWDWQEHVVNWGREDEMVEQLREGDKIYIYAWARGVQHYIFLPRTIISCHTPQISWLAKLRAQCDNEDTIGFSANIVVLDFLAFRNNVNDELTRERV